MKYMSKLMKSVAAVPLSRELAAKYATMQHIPGDRERTPEGVAVHTERMKKGAVLLTWCSVIAKDTGEEYICNGKCSSYAVSQLADEDFPAGQNVICVTYEIGSIDDKEDIYELLGSIDGYSSDDKEPTEDKAGEAMAAIFHEAFRRFQETDNEEERKAIAIAARKEVEKLHDDEQFKCGRPGRRVKP